MSNLYEVDKDDIRAAAILGYTQERMLHTPNATAIYAPGSVSPSAILFDDGVVFNYGLPAFGSDPAAVRLLLQALTPEEREECLRELLNLLVADTTKFSFDDTDDLFALLLAPPATLRNACITATEERLTAPGILPKGNP